MQTNRSLLLQGWMVIGVVAGLAYGQQADASVVNIDFNSGPGVTYAGAAVVGSAGDKWNGIDGGSLGSPATLNSVSLLDSTGAITGLTLSVTGTDGAYDSTRAGCLMSSTSFAPLICDYIYRGRGSNATVTLAGLTPGAAFDLFLYSMANDTGRITDFTLDGVTQSVTAANVPGFVFGTNYTQFTGVVASAGQLSFTFTGAVSTGFFNEGNLDGIQLTQRLSQTVPEPGTLALVGMALVAVACQRRKRYL